MPGAVWLRASAPYHSTHKDAVARGYPREADPNQLTRLGLEAYGRDLDEQGLAVVPQSVLGLPDDFFTHLRDTLLALAGRRTGVHFDLLAGPSGSLPGRPGEIGHVMITHLVDQDPAFDTDYTFEGGALAYVPGSHRFGSRPASPDDAKKAVPVEAPKGSLIVFHGATWHGAFPRTIPGMRISIANYYRHLMVTSQEDIQGTFDRALADDCSEPEVFKELAGFGDQFPYKEQNNPVPVVAGGAA